MPRVGVSVCAVGLLVGAGCAGLPFLFFTDNVTVTLVNETGSSVDVENRGMWPARGGLWISATGVIDG